MRRNRWYRMEQADLMCVGSPGIRERRVSPTCQLASLSLPYSMTGTHVYNTRSSVTHVPGLFISAHFMLNAETREIMAGATSASPPGSAALKRPAVALRTSRAGGTSLYQVGHLHPFLLP